MKAKIGNRYKHYKNNEEYIVIGIGHHSETLEELVIYEGQYKSAKFGDKPIWARPRYMFEETIEFNGKTVQRFQEI